MSLSHGKLRHLKALSNDRGVIAAAAMDQRGSLQKSIAAAKGIDKKDVTDEMLSEFKTAVTKVLTPHASAILLDPEYGLPAAKARSKNAGLLLAYEATGYDNTQPVAASHHQKIVVIDDKVAFCGGIDLTCRR